MLSHFDCKVELFLVKRRAAKLRTRPGSPMAKVSSKKTASDSATGRKAAKKKTASKKAVAEKAVLTDTNVEKSSKKKSASKKAGAAKAPVAKKAAAKKKPAAKKTAAKAAASKTTTKKSSAPAAKKAASKKVSKKKLPAKKVASKVAVAENSVSANDADIDDIDVDDMPSPGKQAAVVPYERGGGHYMDADQLEHFSKKLAEWKQQLMEEVDRTVGHMKDDATNFPDPNDRATQEEEFSLELRTRDRERKLIKKINEAQKRIDDDEYGYCETCGIEIGVNRLEARPTAELCIDCKTLEEIRERQTA